ncbi:MAG: hypothetical protein GY789_23495 [Hyphomicrobiales bacterium]|nr:hypothetical protein [Hyphomicrobiales bacterium]
MTPIVSIGHLSSGIDVSIVNGTAWRSAADAPGLHFQPICVTFSSHDNDLPDVGRIFIVNIKTTGTFASYWLCFLIAFDSPRSDAV